MGSEVARVLGVTNVMSSLLFFFGLLSSLLFPLIPESLWCELLIVGTYFPEI